MTYVIVELSGKADTTWIPEYSSEEEAKTALHEWVVERALYTGLYIVALKVTNQE